MLGQMMDRPLLISQILEYAERNFPNQEIVTNTLDGTIHRYTYRDAAKRSRQLANALIRMGVRPGDRVATMALNTYRHFELYYAISGIGAVCHTINPRYSPEQIMYCVNHAEDAILFFDGLFTPLVQMIKGGFKTVHSYVALADADSAPPFEGELLVYEELIANETDDYAWPEFDERTASILCYTSGTTGDPKGALYTHRSTLLHAFSTGLNGNLGVGKDDVVLPVVPMFHVNAWGVPYLAPMVGCKLVMPGFGYDGEELYELMTAEGVTIPVGVPTIWIGLLNHLRANDLHLPKVKAIVSGGAALPASLVRGLQDERGIPIVQGWGMTEMNPTGAYCPPKFGYDDLSRDEQIEQQLMQGREVFGINLRIVDATGKILPHDGETSGHLQARGPWVVSDYYKGDGKTLTEDGWFDTGDVAALDPDGYIKITDRAKDVIKSGGEWVSSLEIEDAAMLHPAVALAAVIGVPHPKWSERPLLIVTLADGETVTGPELIEFVCERVQKMARPDAVEFVDEIPLGPTGKIMKRELREQFRDYVLEG